MATIFALFEDRTALEQARSQIGWHRHEIIPAVMPGQQPADQTSSYGGRAPTGETKYIEGYTLEDELESKGLPKEETRLFADALRSGSTVLVIYDGTEGLAESLRGAGAGQISSQ